MHLAMLIVCKTFCCLMAFHPYPLMHFILTDYLALLTFQNLLPPSDITPFLNVTNYPTSIYQSNSKV